MFTLLSRLLLLTIVAIGQVPSLDLEESCQHEFLQLLVGFIVIWSLATLIELALIIVSLRGTILEDELRWHSEYLLYIQLGKNQASEKKKKHFLHTYLFVSRKLQDLCTLLRLTKTNIDITQR